MTAPPLIPYGRQTIGPDDIKAVADVLTSDWLTTGPKVAEFERALAEFCGAQEAVAVCNGTAALHCAMHALGIGPGDEVIVPALTFAATSNCVLYQGGTPVFADIDPDSLLIDPDDVKRKMTTKTKAVIGVDYAGQACDYDALRSVAEPRGIAVAADACHALGGADCGRPVGVLADLSTFSLHPVKPITTGEGGAVVTNDAVLAKKMRVFRNHGITTTHQEREAKGSWYYEMVELGFNYRLNDIQCALGISQLKKLPAWIERRQAIARRYEEAFRDLPHVRLLKTRSGVSHAWHLFVVRIKAGRHGSKQALFAELRRRGVGAQVHYLPVYWHPAYCDRFGDRRGMCPHAEAAYEEILSLPIYPGLDDAGVDRVIETVRQLA